MAFRELLILVSGSLTWRYGERFWTKWLYTFLKLALKEGWSLVRVDWHEDWSELTDMKIGQHWLTQRYGERLMTKWFYRFLTNWHEDMEKGCHQSGFISFWQTDTKIWSKVSDKAVLSVSDSSFICFWQKCSEKWSLMRAVPWPLLRATLTRTVMWKEGFR